MNNPCLLPAVTLEPAIFVSASRVFPAIRFGCLGAMKQVPPINSSHGAQYGLPVSVPRDSKHGSGNHMGAIVLKAIELFQLGQICESYHSGAVGQA
jgi:hypothetical protein